MVPAGGLMVLVRLYAARVRAREEPVAEEGGEAADGTEAPASPAGG